MATEKRTEDELFEAIFTKLDELLGMLKAAEPSASSSSPPASVTEDREQESTISTGGAKPATSSSASPTSSPTSSPPRDAARVVSIATVELPPEVPTKCSTTDPNQATQLPVPTATSSAPPTSSSTSAPPQGVILVGPVATTKHPVMTPARCSTLGLHQAAHVLVSGTTTSALPSTSSTAILPQDVVLADPNATTTALLIGTDKSCDINIGGHPFSQFGTGMSIDASLPYHVTGVCASQMVFVVHPDECSELQRPMPWPSFKFSRQGVFVQLKIPWPWLNFCQSKVQLLSPWPPSGCEMVLLLGCMSVFGQAVQFMWHCCQLYLEGFWNQGKEASEIDGIVRTELISKGYALFEFLDGKDANVAWVPFSNILVLLQQKQGEVIHKSAGSAKHILMPQSGAMQVYVCNSRAVDPIESTHHSIVIDLKACRLSYIWMEVFVLCDYPEGQGMGMFNYQVDFQGISSYLFCVAALLCNGRVPGHVEQRPRPWPSFNFHSCQVRMQPQLQQLSDSCKLTVNFIVNKLRVEEGPSPEEAMIVISKLWVQFQLWPALCALGNNFNFKSAICDQCKVQSVFPHLSHKIHEVQRLILWDPGGFFGNFKDTASVLDAYYGQAPTPILISWVLSRCHNFDRETTCFLNDSKQQIFKQDGEAMYYLKLLAGVSGDGRLTFKIKELHLTWHTGDAATIVNSKTFMRNAVRSGHPTLSGLSKAEEQVNQFFLSVFDCSSGAKQLKHVRSACLSVEASVCKEAQLQLKAVKLLALSNEASPSDFMNNTVALQKTVVHVFRIHGSMQWSALMQITINILQMPWDPGDSLSTSRLGDKPNFKKGGMSCTCYGMDRSVDTWAGSLACYGPKKERGNSYIRKRSTHGRRCRRTRRTNRRRAAA